MGIGKKALVTGSLAAAFSLSACQPPSAAIVDTATNNLVTRAQTKCPVKQDVTLLRQIFADAKPSTVARLERRGMTVCLHPGSEPMEKLPTLSIVYYNFGPKTFQLPAQIARDIRAPLMDRVADAGYTSPLELVGDLVNNIGSPRQRNLVLEQQMAAEAAGMRGTAPEAVILHQMFKPKPGN